MRRQPARRGWKLIPLAAGLCLGAFSGAGWARTPEVGLLMAARGVPGRPVRYGLLLANGDRAGHTYHLQVKGLPTGSAVFLQDGAAVSQVTLKSGAAADLALQVTPPGGRSAGHYRFSALATREDGAATMLPLALQVDTAGVLRIAGAVSRLTALSGKEVEFPVTVANRGEAPAKAVKLSTALPPKWQVAVSPASVAALGPGQSVDFQVKLTIPPTQDAGNQQVQVAAESGGVASGPATVHVVVQKGTGYLLLPLILVVASILGTITYFRRQGRR